MWGGGSNQYLDSGATKNIDEAIVRGVGASGLEDLYLGGTLVVLDIQKGDVYLNTGATCTTVYVDAYAAAQANATFTSAGTITSLFHKTGTSTVSAGTVTTCYLDSDALTVRGGTLTNLVQRGGTTTWNTTTTLTSATILGGTFDASADVNAKTITDISSHVGAAINLDNSVGNITITNGVKVYAGSVTFPSGKAVSY